MSRSLLFALLFSVNPLALGSPPEAVAASLAHAQTLDPNTAKYTRFFDLSFAAEADREMWRQAISFWANSLSREAVITRPRDVSPVLLAVDIRDYGWAYDTWENLARVAAADPYFHVRTEVQQKDQYGRPAKSKIVNYAAPWLDVAVITELVKVTASYAPVVRADWWLWQTGAQADRTVGYYEWLALGKKNADFQALIGADPAAARKVKKEIAAAVARSTVTLNNRSIARMQTITGPWYFTQDYKASKDKQNTVRLLDFSAEPPQGDATEQYGTLPNGLFTFWLANANGERQDTAPDFIASDGKSTSTDRRVHVGVSCVRCHAPGIQPIDDHARKLFRGDIKLVSVDYEKLKRLKQLYLSDLPRQLARDQADYAEALAKANGLTPEVNARTFAAAWAAYEADVTLEAFARELGCTPERLVEALKGYGSQLDPVLAGYIQTPPLPARREHVEEVYHLAYGALLGGKP